MIPEVDPEVLRGFREAIEQPYKATQIEHVKQLMADKQKLSDQKALLTQALEALEQYTVGVDEQSPVMKAWDMARQGLLDGDDSDLPRMIFELALDEVDTKACKTIADIKAAQEGRSHTVDFQRGSAHCINNDRPCTITIHDKGKLDDR